MKKNALFADVRFGFLLVPAIFTIAAIPHSAWGDGMVFREEKAYKKPPTIPTQRAMVFFEEGKERLIVESTIDGEGQRFGWILPVPAKPSKFEPVSPGLLKTLSLNLGPEIIHDMGFKLKVVYFLSIFVAIRVLIALVPRRYHSSLKAFFWVFFFLSVFVFFVVFFVPTLGRNSGASLSIDRLPMPEVKILETATVGNYQVQVLSAATAKGLDDWLKANGFVTLNSKGQAIAAEYIKNGWVFVAAKLQRSGAGLLRPHPLAVDFAVPKPVYPMRLTSLVDRPVYLELFVVANKTAEVKGLELEVADVFFESKNSWDGIPYIRSYAYGFSIFHPAVFKEPMEGKMVTKLSGTLKPRQMDRDLAIRLEGAEPCRRSVYSYRGARDCGLIGGLSIWLILTIVGFAARYSRVRSDDGIRFAFSRLIVPITLLACMVWGGMFLLLPKTDTFTISQRGYRKPSVPHSYKLMNQIMALSKNQDLYALPKPALNEYLDRYFAQHPVYNEFTGERVRREESPGNFTIPEDNSTNVFRIYDWQGFPIDYPL